MPRGGSDCQAFGCGTLSLQKTAPTSWGLKQHRYSLLVLEASGVALRCGWGRAPSGDCGDDPPLSPSFGGLQHSLVCDCVTGLHMALSSPAVSLLSVYVIRTLGFMGPLG